jgi:acyl-CoA synthetase (AMP-forming)/AMP-acid ligase II
MIFSSPYPDVAIPELALSDFVLERAEEFGDKPAIIDGPTGRQLSYLELVDAVKRVAGGLAEGGFGKGDVLAIHCPNVPEYAVAFHAVAMLGGVNTTINPAYTVEELEFQLTHAGAKALLTTQDFLEPAREAARRSGVGLIYVLGQAGDQTPFSTLLESEPLDRSTPARADDVVALPYSSGTTGLPKGVMLTHKNLVANICQSQPVQPITSNDRAVGVLPFFHIYGMTVVMNGALREGATLVTMPRFDLESFLGLVQAHQITRANLAPPIILALAKHPLVESYDLSSLRVIISGAAPLSSELAQACANRVGCKVVQGYGLTETSPVTHVVPERALADHLGSIGPLIPNTQCKVVDVDDNRELEGGESGELCIRGPQVMKGYLNNVEATEATIDAQGWLHTGDIGYCDPDGYFFLVDRLKELIKYKGYQVPPAELEAVLLNHPAVADAAVVASPDEEAGEVPKAYIVLAQEAAAEDITEFVSQRVAPYKKLRRLEFIDEIPKSPSGKILRRTLIDRERQVAVDESSK